MATSLSNETQTTNHTQTMATPKVKMMDASVGYSPPSSKSNSVAPRIIKPSKQVSPSNTASFSRQDEHPGYHSIGLSAHNRKQAATGTQIVLKGGELLKSGGGIGFSNKTDEDDEAACGRSSSNERTFSNGNSKNYIDDDPGSRGASQWNYLTSSKVEQTFSKQYSSEVASKLHASNVLMESNGTQNKGGRNGSGNSNKNLNSPEAVSTKKHSKGSTSKNNNRGQTNQLAKKDSWSGHRDESNDDSSQTRHSPSSPTARYGSSLSGSLGGVPPSSLIQSAGLAYPFLYPNTYHLTASGFPASPARTQSYGGGSSSVYSSSLQQQSASERNTTGVPSTSTSATNSTSGNSRRGGKKKAPLASQTQNPEFRLFFNLRRRDQSIQSNKGGGGQAHHHQVYKAKNTLTIMEWFKKLTVEERVNSLSTVCPHLTETFINMVQRMEPQLYGQSSCFARIGPHAELKYYGGGSNSYPGQYSSYFQDTHSSYQLCFDDLFYHRQSQNEYEQRLKNGYISSSERAKNEAEQEILKHVRLTDYYQQLDTLTVNEELVLDPDYFLKLMSLATVNQAFTSVCQFELRPSQQSSSSSSSYQYHMQYGSSSSNSTQTQLVVDQPAWFKPKSFHSFATWVIVALEENLWAHYNYELGQNLSTGIKLNDLQQIFRERTDSGTMDLEMGQLAAYWRECPDKDRRALLESLRTQVVKEWESAPLFQETQAGGSGTTASQQFKNKVMQNKAYQLTVKEKPLSNLSAAIQEQVDFELRGIVDLAMRSGSEFEMMGSLMYTMLDRFQLKIFPIQRKLLDLIKKKYKDDLMENLLQEEYLGSAANKANNHSNHMSNNLTNNLGQSKSFKKKKKKPAKQASAQEASNNSEPTNNSQQTTSQVPDTNVTLDISNNPAQQTDIPSQEEKSIQQQSQPQQKKKKPKSNSSNPSNQSNNTNQAKQSQGQSNNTQELQQKDVNNLMQDKNYKNNMTAAGANPNKKKKNNPSNTNGYQPPQNDFNNSTNNLASSQSNQVGSYVKRKGDNNQQQKESSSTGNIRKNDNNGSTSVVNQNGMDSGNTNVLKNQQANTNTSIMPSQADLQLQQRLEEDSRIKNNYKKAAIDANEEETKDSSAIQSTAVLDQSPSNETSKEDQEIRAYLVELTNFMITEVCKRAAASSENFRKDNLSEQEQIISSLGIDGELVSKGKDDGIHINNNSSSIEQKPFENISSQSPRESEITSDSQQSQAKDTARQSENSQKKKNQQAASITNKKTDEVTTDKKQQANKSGSTASQSKVAVKNTEAEGAEQVKKKRNKKKAKLTDTDIMNNFMKSLHQADDESINTIKRVIPSTDVTSTQQKKKQQQPLEEDSKKKNNTGTTFKAGTTATRKYTEDSQALASEQEERKNKPGYQQQQKRPAAQQKKKQSNTIQIEDRLNGAEEVKEILQGLVDKVSSQIVVLAEESKHQEDPMCDTALYEDSMKTGEVSEDPKQDQPAKLNGGVDPKVFYQNFQPFIPSSISTTNSQGDQHSIENEQAENNNGALTDCEIKEESKQLTAPGATASGINQQHYRTPPQSSKKQDLNQLSQQSIGVNHFASGEGVNMQSFSANSGSTLSNNFKRLAEAEHLMPLESSFAQPSQSTTFNNFYGGYQSFGGGGAPADFTPSQQYPPVPLTPPVPPSLTTLNQHGNNATPVFYPQSSRSPQTSHSMIFSSNNSYTQKNNGGGNRSNYGKGPGMYQRPHAQRGVPGRGAHQHQQQVQLQVMNLSQSMQEQIQAQNQNPCNYPPFQPNMMDTQSNIFYQDQSAMADNYGNQKSMVDHQVFPYLMEKSNSVNIHSNPVPTYSPQQQYSHSHFQPTGNNEALSNTYGQSSMGGLSNLAASFRPTQGGHNQSMSQPYYDQSQDLIFQIVNSIKSNHSMSPVPQQITSPPLHFHDQMSHHSNDHNQSSSDHQQNTNDPLTAFFDQLDQEISLYLAQIQDNLNNLSPERDLIISKLQETAARVFDKESPKIEIFGSIITGLALESSDLDVAVTGLRIHDRHMMIDDLLILARALQSEWRCIESFKAIETASIPVIKMKVDLLKLREEEMKERDGEADFSTRPIPDNQRYLSIDITFDDNGSSNQSHSPYMNNYMMMGDSPQDVSQTQTHLGLASCRLVQWYIQNYRNLKQVAILMKKFLAIHNYNSPYYGGLSSYSTVILIVAFMNCYGLRDGFSGAYYNRHENLYITQEEMTPARLLMCFLDFYSYMFNPSMLGISIAGNGSFFQLNGGLSSTSTVVAQGLNGHSLYMQGSPVDHILMSPGGGMGGFTGLSGTITGNSNTSNFMILDPLNSQNNTTKNSFLTREILKQFHSALSSLKANIGKSTQSPGITQSALAQFLNLEQSPLNQSPSQFNLSGSSNHQQQPTLSSQFSISQTATSQDQASKESNQGTIVATLSQQPEERKQTAETGRAVVVASREAPEPKEQEQASNLQSTPLKNQSLQQSSPSSKTNAQKKLK